MMTERNMISSISMMYRQAHRFYDKKLEEYNISSGQLTFLLCIHEHEGISMYGVAQLGHFDKGTVTKGIQSWKSRDISGWKRMRQISVQGVYTQRGKRF